MARLDFQGDAGHRTLHKIGKLYELPEYVKQASQEEFESSQKTAEFYADARLPYQFPCHTKAATLLSAAYFLENRHSVPDKVRHAVVGRFAKFAEYWGIVADMRALAVKNAEINREVEYPDTDYAIVKVSEAGKQRLYPMRNRDETKAAAEWFADNLPALRAEYGFSDRQLIATKIMDKISEHSLSLPETVYEIIERHAGIGTGSPTKVANFIRQRAKFEKDAKAKIGLASLAEFAENMPQIFMDFDKRSMIADFIDRYDREHGLLNKYCAAIPAPEDMLFEVTRTKIAELEDTVFMTTTGSTYTREQLAKLSASRIRSVFGDEIADGVCRGIRLDPVKMADVAMTLPLGDAQLFDQLMTSVGEEPISKTSYHIGLSPEVLAKIASA